MKYRSVLFVPGHEEKKIKKAYTLGADVVVIDLESTVPEDEKENAKKYKVDENTELIRVIVHGLLHLIGYKDKTKKEKTLMSEKENKYLSLYKQK